MFERVKLAYQIYNFFHKKELYHNELLYKKLGLKKKYYSSVSNKDFAGTDESKIAFEYKRLSLDSIPLFEEFSEDTQMSIRDFDENGFCLLKSFWSKEQVDKVNTEIDRLTKDGTTDFKTNNRMMFAIHKSPFLNEICNNEQLDPILDYLIQGKSKLFQSINFLNGSQQRTHSDSIHMTTFPQGGLLGVWIALEDVDQGNGTIHYYPKSHKLPYFMNDEYGNEGNKWLLGDVGYGAYEDMIEKKIAEYKLQKQIFNAKAGDMFIWHANLLHGGEAHTDKSRTRKSMVLHYFDTNRICYHEVTQRPALFRNH
ncbi:MAG: phytanoyl-CoA dioxygenase family protein [Bacteroidota bacterium]